ncbi:MAG: hypothetical protein Q9228_006620 [Teloschistes exilis]
MAPKDSKRSRKEAGEDQYGSIFSVSGPVIVAENMLGCAMYELVCSNPQLLEIRDNLNTIPGPGGS